MSLNASKIHVESARIEKIEKIVLESAFRSSRTKTIDCDILSFWVILHICNALLLSCLN